MACGYLTGPARSEARLNSRFANVKSLKQSRRLTPRSGHLSACLTGPIGALVRWFSMGKWIYSAALRGGSSLWGIHCVIARTCTPNCISSEQSVAVAYTPSRKRLTSTLFRSWTFICTARWPSPKVMADIEGMISTDRRSSFVAAGCS